MRIAVNGARGKMGQAVVEFATGHEALELVAQCDVGDNLADCLRDSGAQVLVDFTRPEARMDGIQIALEQKVAAVVGTTGYTPQDLEEIRGWVKSQQTGCLIAPNFQVGNVLMQQFAAKAARYFEYAEIIEYHHPQKVDFPSGTAMRTAELMAEAKGDFNPQLADKVANLEGARGATYHGIRVHAVRMPGFIASQEVLFGAPGQYLTIRHDSIDRASYMPGVLMAARYIVQHQELVYGLEHILDA